MRTEGVPSGPTVASAMASGSLGSLLAASAYQSPKSASGSDFSRIMTHNMRGPPKPSTTGILSQWPSPAKNKG